MNLVLPKSRLAQDSPSRLFGGFVGEGPGRARGGITLLLVLLLVLLGRVGYVQGEEQSFREYDLKAGYVYQFCVYMSWPSGSFASSNTPLVVGIVGEDPFGPVLPEILGKKSVNGRRATVVVKHFGDDLSGCHLLFISRSEKERAAAILESVKDKPVVTVSDLDSFCERGGMFRLLVVKGRVKFEINKQAIEATGLRVPATLGAFGTEVKTETNFQ